jgi:hypothetical protein
MTAAALMMTSRRLVAAEHQAGTAPRTLVAELPADGEALAKLWKQGGLSAAGVTLVVPRHKVLVRRLKIPAGTPEEIDGMVGLQLEQALDLPLAEVRYAYTPGAPDPEGQIEISAAALRVDDLEAARALLAKAGLMIESVVVSTWCLDELAGPPAEGAQVVAVLEPDFGEVVLLERGEPRAARAFENVADGALVGELTRTLRVLESQAQVGEVRRLALVGRRHEAHRAALAGVCPRVEILPLPKEEMDPVLAPVLGACAARALHGRAAGPDLLAERVVVSRWKPHRRKLVAGAVAGAFVLVWLAVGSWLWLKQSRLDAVEAQIRKNKRSVDELRAVEAKADLLNQWVRPRVSWAWVLGGVLEAEKATRAGEYDRVLHLTSVSLSYHSERRGADELLRLRVEGVAKKNEDAMNLAKKLRSTQGVLNMGTPVLERPTKESFPIPFSIEGMLLPRRWTYAPEAK